MHIKSGLLLVAALVLLIIPAYANVLETSLALRDKLPASTLANIPDFVARMAAVGSSVTYGPQGYYAVYNADDLRGIFGNDAVIIPSGGIVQITYNRGGTFRYFGALHGVIVADSARKAITITKGGFISSENVSVNIAGSEIVIGARNPAKAAFKISRDSVYVQNEYFIGCEPERETTEEDDCAFEKCPECSEPIECNEMELLAYEAQSRNMQNCEIKTIVSPQYAYANITGSGNMFGISLLEYFREGAGIGELYDKTREAKESSVRIRDLSNLKIAVGQGMKFFATAPSGGSIAFNGIQAIEEFEYSIKKYSTPAEGKIASITGDRLSFYALDTPNGILFKLKDVGNTPHMDNAIRIFRGWGPEDERSFEIMKLREGSAYFYSSYEDIENSGGTAEENLLEIENPFVFSCLKKISSFNFGCVYKTNKQTNGVTSEYYKIYPKADASDPMLLEISSSIAFASNDVWNGRQAYIEVKPFGINDGLSRVRIENNANTAIDFTGKDITITPVAGDWAELGVSFKASIYPLSLPSQCDPGIFIGEDCAIPETIEVYDTIECKLPERKCYLNGVEVTGFVGGSMQRTKFCHEDSQCYENQKCIEGMCVMKATCGNIRIGTERGTLLQRGGINKANVLFIGDGYSSEEEFTQDALKVIDEQGVNHGIFSVPPFSEDDNIKKFVFHSMYGSAAPKTFRAFRKIKC